MEILFTIKGRKLEFLGHVMRNTQYRLMMMMMMLLLTYFIILYIISLKSCGLKKSHSRISVGVFIFSVNM